VKEHKNGTVTYEHQMLAAVLVHPDFKEVSRPGDCRRR
jgi:hypothetical protein